MRLLSRLVCARHAGNFRHTRHARHAGNPRYARNAGGAGNPRYARAGNFVTAFRATCIGYRAGRSAFGTGHFSISGGGSETHN